MKTRTRRNTSVTLTLTRKGAEELFDLLNDQACRGTITPSMDRVLECVNDALDDAELRDECMAYDGSGCPTCDPCVKGKHKSGRCA